MTLEVPSTSLWSSIMKERPVRDLLYLLYFGYTQDLAIFSYFQLELKILSWWQLPEPSQSQTQQHVPGILALTQNCQLSGIKVDHSPVSILSEMLSQKQKHTTPQQPKIKSTEVLTSWYIWDVNSFCLGLEWSLDWPVKYKLKCIWVFMYQVTVKNSVVLATLVLLLETGFWICYAAGDIGITGVCHHSWLLNSKD